MIATKVVVGRPLLNFRPNLRFAHHAACKAAFAFQPFVIKLCDGAGKDAANVWHEDFAAPLPGFLTSEIAEQDQPIQFFRPAAPGIGLGLVIRPYDYAAHLAATRLCPNVNAVLRITPHAK